MEMLKRRPKKPRLNEYGLIDHEIQRLVETPPGKHEGYTDFKNHVVGAPMSPDIHDRGIRQHEALHTIHSRNLPTTNMYGGWLDRAEDAYLYHIANISGVAVAMQFSMAEVIRREYTPEFAQEMADTENWNALIVGAFWRVLTGQGVQYAAVVIQAPIRVVLLETVDRMRGVVEAVLGGAARWALKAKRNRCGTVISSICKCEIPWFKPHPRKIRRITGTRTEMARALQQIADEAKMMLKLAASINKLEIPPMPAGLGENGKDNLDGPGAVPRMSTGGQSEENPWSDMKIIRPNLVTPKKGVNKSWRPASTGGRLGRLERVVTDFRIFNRPGRMEKFDGTILIDVSGSMELDIDQIEKLVAKSPGATVAIYSAGRLIVAARKGKMASRKDFKKGGCNECDGPALEWLSTQPGPRFWLSDGAVNGKDHRATTALLQECLATCRRAKIYWIESLAKFIELWGDPELSK